jgi:phenylacetate-CoA ligase
VMRPMAQTNPTSPYLVIESLVGRSNQVPRFITRDGKEDFFHPINLDTILAPGVMRFQMQVVSKTRFLFKVMLAPSLDAAQRSQSIAAVHQQLREMIDQKLMHNVTFEVVPADDLPLDPRTRKFQLVVDAPES